MGPVEDRDLEIPVIVSGGVIFNYFRSDFIAEVDTVLVAAADSLTGEKFEGLVTNLLKLNNGPWRYKRMKSK